MINKKKARLRRAVKSRARMHTNDIHRLCVYRTPRHIYAQIIVPDGSCTVANASSLEKSMKSLIHEGGKKAVAAKVGELIAQRALEKGIEQLAFDRSGYKYHGRVKALADAARTQGLKF